jgi:hypothetical protein
MAKRINLYAMESILEESQKQASLEESQKQASLEESPKKPNPPKQPITKSGRGTPPQCPCDEPKKEPEKKIIGRIWA